MSKNYNTVLLLDMSRAYDRVSYSILLTKLREIGISGKALSSLKLHLKDKQQYVQNGTPSSRFRATTKTTVQMANCQQLYPPGKCVGMCAVLDLCTSMTFLR